MGRKGKFSVLEKLEAVEDYLSGKRGTLQICRDMGIDDSSFYSWLQKYQLFGADGLVTVMKNKYYSEAIKIQAVKDYLDGKASQSEICRQYEISGRGILQQWIKRYNGHKPFKSHNSEGDRNMTKESKGRKTTFEERIEIVSFCIANNYDYQMAANKFYVSYQQVYLWVKKYVEHGSESLSDRRGKRNGLDQMSEAEKLAGQIKLLEAENNRLKMENDYLKKLEEIERRR